MPWTNPRKSIPNHHGLTPREEAFVKEVLKNGRKLAEAYVATCTQETASKDPHKRSTQVAAYRMSRRPKIRAAIEAADKALAVKTENILATRYAVSKERVIEELARLAFTNQTDVTTWSKAEGVKTKDSAELDDDTKAAVTEITQTKDGGIRVKLADKQKALDGLAKALGLYKEEKSDRPMLAVQFIIEGKNG